MNDFACNLVEVLTSPGLIASESWLEAIYWIGGITIAVFAFLAYRQRAKLEGVKLLLDLDKEWHELADARRELHEIRYNVQRNVAENYPDLNVVLKEDKLKDGLSEALRELRNSNDYENRNIYEQLLRYLSFFEKIGFLAKHKLIPFKYVLGLYKGPILDASDVFEKHIEEWRNIPAIPPGLFEGASYLFRRTRRSGR